MGFTHQVEESWRRRRQIELFSRPAEVDYRRLPVADVGSPEETRIRDVAKAMAAADPPAGKGEPARLVSPSTCRQGR